jgi:PAS domain S-box-containing protein
MRELLLSLPVAVAYVVGPDLVFEFANENYYRAVGRRDLIGRPYAEMLAEVVVGQPQYTAAVFRVLRTGEPRGRREEVWVRGEGAEPELVYVDSAYLPVRNESGGVVGVLIFGTDVSDRVWDRRRLGGLAERLARSEGRYRNLFETLPLGILHLDADGSILESNPAAGTILGLQPPEMITWPLPTWSGAVREDGSAMRRDDCPVMKGRRESHHRQPRRGRHQTGAPGAPCHQLRARETGQPAHVRSGPRGIGAPRTAN